MVLPFLLLCLPIALCTGDDLDFPGCPGRDRCSDMSRNAAINFLQRNCECDSDCVDFGDCCEDYPRDDAQQRNSNNSDRPMRCWPFDVVPENIGVYMVSDCPAGTEPSLREKCEDSHDDDPITIFPNGPTYPNHHCALCNGHDVRSMYEPYYKVRCNHIAPDRSYFGQSFDTWHGDGWEVVYESETHACLLYFNFSTIAPHYYPRPYDASLERDDLFNMDVSEVARRDLKFKLRDLLASKSNSRVERRNLLLPDFGLRLCRFYDVTKCPEGYSDERVSELCGRYEAAVYGVVDAYRNPHCALCYGEDLRTLVCDPSEVDMGRRKEFSFAHLFDVSGEGDVGRRIMITCTKDQKYDPVSKTCRNLVCAIPGYVRRNNKCVKISSLKE